MKHYVLVASAELDKPAEAFKTNNIELKELDNEPDITDNIDNIVNTILDIYNINLRQDLKNFDKEFCIIQSSSFTNGIAPLVGDLFHVANLYNSWTEEYKKDNCEYVVYLTNFYNYFKEWPENDSEYKYPELLDEFKTRMCVDQCENVARYYVGVCIISKQELEELAASKIDVNLVAKDVSIEGCFNTIKFDIVVPDESIIRKLPCHITNIINASWINTTLRGNRDE